LQGLEYYWVDRSTAALLHFDTTRSTHKNEWTIASQFSKIVIPNKVLNIKQFINSNDLTKNPTSIFLYSLVVGDYDAVKIGIRNKVEFDYHIAYILAALLNHVAIIQLLIDAFPINPLCCESLAMMSAITNQNIGMVKLIISQNAGIISKKITGIDGTYDIQKWIDALNEGMNKLNYLKCDKSVTKLYKILSGEIKLRLDDDIFFKTIVNCLNERLISKDAIDLILNMYDKLFGERELWRSNFCNMLYNNQKPDVFQYLIEMDYVHESLDKHRLLYVALNMRGDCKNAIIQTILDCKRITWNIAAEFEQNEEHVQSNYLRLTHHSDYTRKFLRENDISPTFGADELFMASLVDLDLETVKYCLRDKSLQPINYWLATNNIFMKVYENIRFNDAKKIEHGTAILELLLQDGRALPYANGNKFLHELIKDGTIGLIELLIKSGNIFFPLCVTHVREYHADSVKFFAENEDYFQQIISCKKNSEFVDEIVKCYHFEK
jgi:hypothetical protein